MDGYYWQPIKDGDARGLWLWNRHYSKYHYKDNRKPRTWVGPGERIVLLGSDCLALWVWRKMNDGGMDHQEGVCCSVFRNEGPRLSSELINEACELAWQKWPNERLYTYINASAIRSHNPGYCYKIAGWQICGQTKARGHLILEKWPD